MRPLRIGKCGMQSHLLTVEMGMMLGSVRGVVLFDPPAPLGLRTQNIIDLPKNDMIIRPEPIPANIKTS